MATTLFYNDQQILSGQPTPLVGREDSMIIYGERWADQVSITLNGQITGCPLEFNGLIAEQERLLSIFNKDFQTFKIEEDGNIIYSSSYVQVQSVRFPASKYVGILDYEVTLLCYPENLFSGQFGVLEPEDSWEFSETEDFRLRATHTISARGFNTSSTASNALENAKTFVQARTGVFDTVQPYFIKIPSGMVPCLKTIKEDINRFNGTYSITATYEGDLFYNNDGVLRYTTNFDCSRLDGVAKVGVNGEIEGCANASIDDVRARYATFDVYGAALATYQESVGASDLNTAYLRSGVTEDAQMPRLSFQVEFDNFTGANVFFDYRATVNSGDNDIISVAVEGTIGARGDLKTKWERASGYYSDGVDLFGIAETAYTSFVGGGYPIQLNPAFLQSGVTFNKFAGEIRTNASWDNREIPVNGFSTLDYTLDFVPSLEKVVAKPLATDSNGPICASEYYVVDLGYKNRSAFTINGNGKLDCDTTMATAIANLKTFANGLFSTYCPSTRAVLETNVLTTGYNTVSFTFGWTAESANNVVVPKSNYTNINTLSLK